MSEGRSLDWEQVAEVWARERADRDVVAKLRSEVRRRTALMRATLAGEVLLLVSLAIMSRWYLGATPTLAQAVLIGTAWLWALFLFAFAIWNRRESWRADAEGVGGYLRLLERRGRASLRTATWAGPLAAVQGVVVLALLVASPAGRGVKGPWYGPVVVVLGMVAAVVAWGWWYGRAARRKLAELAETRALLMAERDMDEHW